MANLEGAVHGLRTKDGRARAGHGAGSSSSMRSTNRLVSFVLDTRYDDIPKSTIHATKRMILDEIIVTAATINTPQAKALYRLKMEQGGAAESTLAVEGMKVPAQSAAYVHAQLANLLDADETMLNRMHTVSASVMAGLAMAEKIGASGKDFIAAVATGYDITARIGLSLEQFIPDGKGGLVFAPLFGWSWMTFGAAMTVARLLKLDHLQAARAIGQALVTAPVSFDIKKHTAPEWTDGIPANWHKYQLCGPSAEAGINAALLASYGWVAQTDVLDEGSEFWRSFGAVGCNWDAMYGDLGKHWYINDCAIKPWPFCRFGHAALDIFERILTTEKLKADDISEVILSVPPHELCVMLGALTTVDEPLKLLHSVPTGMALIALGVPTGPKWYEVDLKSDRVRNFARKVRHQVVEKWGQALVEQQSGDGFFRRLPTEVVVRTNTGREYSAYAEYAHGDPWAPGFEMTDAELGDKARGYLDGILPSAKIEALVKAVDALESAPNVNAVAQAMVR